MELAAEEGFDLEEVEDASARPATARCRCSPSSAARTSASRRWSTASSAAARPSSRTCPGVTRDRVTYEAEWDGPRASRSSTPAAGSRTRTASTPPSPRRPRSPIELADAVLFVVDATVGATDTDEARRAAAAPGRQAGRPRRQQGRRRSAARPTPPTLWSLGLGEPCPVSALHGRGVGDLLDDVLEVLPEASARSRGAEVGGPRRVALIGRPNVGKSLLLNKAGAARSASSSTTVAGTTRDPVDELIELGGKIWRFVDTAGIRRRVHLQQGADFYASLRTAAALEKAEVAVVLLDASEPITEQDVRDHRPWCVESGRALVLAYNKWDLLDEERRHYLEREIEQDLAQVAVGAAGQHLGAAPAATWRSWCPALETALDVVGHPHPDRPAQRLPRRARRRATRTRCAAASSRASCSARRRRTRPPRFVLFATGFLEAGLPPLHRAPAARGVRLRGHADRGLGAGAGEARPEEVAGWRRGRAAGGPAVLRGGPGSSAAGPVWRGACRPDA